jgi:RNA polymerase sigma-70 factor, ECF subfamily
MLGANWDGADEERLVAAATAGDLRAFDALVRRYRPAVILLASQILRTRELAEDAAQDALLAAYAALPRLAEPARFDAWLGAIARHRAKRLAAGEARQPVPIEEVVLAYTPALAERVVENDLARKVRCALRRLPEEIRPVVELYYLEGWRVGQIAGFLGLPETTVKWRLHAGRKQLRGLLPSLEKNQ